MASTPIETPRMRQLKALAGAMPVANQRIANGIQQGQATQLQAAIGQAQPGVGGPQMAQQMGAQAAQQAGATQLQAAQTAQQQAGQLGQTGLQQAGIESQQRVGQQELAGSEQQRRLSQQLNATNNQVKNALLDQQLQFSKDERGRTMLNDRQLADVAILKAKNAEDFANYQQATEQVADRKVKAMEYAYNLMRQSMESGYDAQGRRLDFESKQKIKQSMNNAEKMLNDEKNRIAARQAMWGAAGTVIGAVIGGATGGSQGAKTGASVGGAGGGYAGTQSQ